MDFTGGGSGAMVGGAAAGAGVVPVAGIGGDCAGAGGGAGLPDSSRPPTGGPGAGGRAVAGAGGPGSFGVRSQPHGAAGAARELGLRVTG